MRNVRRIAMAESGQDGLARLLTLGLCLLLALLLPLAAGALEPSKEAASQAEENEYLILNDAELFAFTALSGIGGNRVVSHADGVAVSVTREGAASHLGQPAQTTFGRRMIAGVIDLSDTWAVTGQWRDALSPGLNETETRLGLRYTTRAGEQILLAVEPSLSWRAARTGLNDVARRSTELSVGASATFAIGAGWYVSGMAQIDQGMAAAEDGSLLPNQTNLIGGFVTGLRF